MHDSPASRKDPFARHQAGPSAYIGSLTSLVPKTIFFDAQIFRIRDLQGAGSVEREPKNVRFDSEFSIPNEDFLRPNTSHRSRPKRRAATKIQAVDSCEPGPRKERARTRACVVHAKKAIKASAAASNRWPCRRPLTAGGVGLRQGAAECRGGELFVVCHRPVAVACWTKGSLESEADRRSTQAATATRLVQTAAERLSKHPSLQQGFSHREVEVRRSEPAYQYRVSCYRPLGLQVTISRCLSGFQP